MGKRQAACKRPGFRPWNQIDSEHVNTVHLFISTSSFQYLDFREGRD